MTTLQIAFKKAGIKVRKQTKRWPRAKYGTKGQTRREGGINNLHFATGA